MNWQELKGLLQSMGDDGKDFEKLVAKLLGALLETHFEIAKSGYQPRGDALNTEKTIVLQTKKYSDNNTLNRKEIEGDIREAYSDPELPNLQAYVLASSRNLSTLLLKRLENIGEETGLDIITFELTDSLSDFGALCVIFWEDIHPFLDFSNTYQYQKLSDWTKEERDRPETIQKIEELTDKLKHGQRSRNQVQKDTERYLLKRFGGDSNHNLRFNYPIDLPEAIERESLESEIATWWETPGKPVCYLEGEEGMGKSWLAAKGVNTICSDKHIVTFWLDNNRWNGCKSLDDLLQVCLETIPCYQDEKKLAKLKLKIRNIWWPPTLIVLDGVNEGNAIETAKRILDEYFTHRNELENRIRFLLTTRPLHAYRNFKHNLWEGCHKIIVEPFNELEFREALVRGKLQPNDLPSSLIDIAKIPRYFQTCINLREFFDSFNNVTKEMVLWADLLYKIKYTDPQVREKFDWQSVEDAQDILAKLATESKWVNVNDAPKASVELLEKCFSNNYQEVRRDLEEQRIALKAGKIQAELSKDHVVLGWAIHLSSIFDCTEFIGIEDLLERFQQELEPIPSEDLRTKALFVALQITAISPNPGISQDQLLQEQLSQKRTALMLAGFRSHNAQFKNEHISFWVREDTEAYAQVVEFEFDRHNAPKYEEMLIEPLAKMWGDKEGQIDRLASRLKKWLLPTHSVNSPENRKYVNFKGVQVPRKDYDPQVQLSAAALSILSQRPERKFLETLARCYEILERYEDLDRKDIGVLMRWGYTEKVLEDLYSLAEQSPSDSQLLKGVCRLVDCFRVGLPPNLESALSKEDLEKRAIIERYSHKFNLFIERIRNQERILTGDSPEANANCGYYGLDCLAVRKDLPAWCDEDQNELKEILHYTSAGPERGISKDLIPWIAKYTPENYRELSCNLKINALNPEYPPHRLRETQELVFQQTDRERITKAILEMKECFVQGDDSSAQRARLLTEILLFSASGDELIDWFQFLASHESLRESIFTEILQISLNKLLSEPVVGFVQQKLKILRSSPLDNQFPSNIESEETTEEDFWWWIYLCISDNDENLGTWALENLKRRKSNLHSITFHLLYKATLDSNRFLSEVFIHENVRKHLFLKDGRFFTTPIYNGENPYSYEDLVSVLPQEIVGSFLCSPKRRADLSRWGKELMELKYSILQGTKKDFDYDQEMRFWVNPKVLRTWAEENKPDFLCLANKYLAVLSKSPRYHQVCRKFTGAIFHLLLRLQPTVAMEYYHQWNAEDFQPVYATSYGIPIHVFQLWHIEDFNLSEHHDLRCKLLEECLNDEKIMFMVLAALIGGGEKELWNLVTQKYLVSPYAKQRNLGVSILPWFGTCEAIDHLERLKSEDPSQWVRGHAAWAYEVAQQERSCQEVYREVLQAGDLFGICAVFEQIEPASSPIARWWHCEIEKEENIAELQDSNPKLFALLYRFWSQWRNSSHTKNNVEVCGRKLREYCRGERFLAGRTPRIAPWWKPDSGSDSM